jgi:hypothetical protein
MLGLVWVLKDWAGTGLIRQAIERGVFRIPGHHIRLAFPLRISLSLATRHWLGPSGFLLHILPTHDCVTTLLEHQRSNDHESLWGNDALCHWHCPYTSDSQLYLSSIIYLNLWHWGFGGWCSMLGSGGRGI